MSDRFRKVYKVLSDEDKLAMAGVKDAATHLETELNRFVHDGREKSLALIKLEECVFWAIKSVTG